MIHSSASVAGVDLHQGQTSSDVTSTQPEEIYKETVKPKVETTLLKFLRWFVLTSRRDWIKSRTSLDLFLQSVVLVKLKVLPTACVNNMVIFHTPAWLCNKMSKLSGITGNVLKMWGVRLDVYTKASTKGPLVDVKGTCDQMDQRDGHWFTPWW